MSLENTLAMAWATWMVWEGAVEACLAAGPWSLVVSEVSVVVVVVVLVVVVFEFQHQALLVLY